jgi:hypothetical protein
MKRLLVITIASTIMFSCVTKRETINTGLSSMAYDVLPEEKVQTNGTRLWILFIPIGIGKIKYGNRKELAIQRFLKRTGADAIQNGMIVDKKIIIPLILVNYSYRWTVLKGKPLKVKS